MVSHVADWVRRRPYSRRARGLASSARQEADAPLYSSPPALALWWVKQQELAAGGIRRHSAGLQAGAGVTGGLIPTLMDYGEKEVARRLAGWLIKIQNPGGDYGVEDANPSFFDTGLALHGLLAVSDQVPHGLCAAERAADYLLRQLAAEGREGIDSLKAHPRAAMSWLSILPVLRRASKALNRPGIQQAADRYLGACGRHLDALTDEDRSHVPVRALEALIDLDRSDLAAPVLDQLRRRQNKKGAVGTRAAGPWICIPGLAQLAICWYKTGQPQAADRAMQWLEVRQKPSGGFAGSSGRGAAYFPHVELAWAAKLYLDAHGERLRASFNGHLKDRLPSEVSATDGRAQAVQGVVRAGDRVAEIGCGHGRFLKMLRQQVPGIRCTGVDISSAMLKQLPAEIEGIEGALESVPLPDDQFDVVFSVEAIEHSANPEAAAAEMIRIARPGGWVLIIDKQQSHWGRKACPSWERWPSLEGLQRLLQKGCDKVSAHPIGYNNIPASDGLMVAWLGRRRSRSEGRPGPGGEGCRTNSC